MTTVTVTALTDSSGNLYANGYIEAIFIPVAGASSLSLADGSSVFPTFTNGKLDSFGSCTLSVTGNDIITPAGSVWKFSVLDATRTVGFSASISITGASQDITATLHAAAASITTVSTVGPLATGLTTVPFSATPTFDATGGGAFQITLSGNITSSTLSGAKTGQLLTFIFIQDATGGRTVVYPANVLNAMQPDPTAGAKTIQLFQFDGTNAYPLSVATVN